MWTRTTRNVLFGCLTATAPACGVTSEPAGSNEAPQSPGSATTAPGPSTFGTLSESPPGAESSKMLPASSVMASSAPDLSPPSANAAGADPNGLDTCFEYISQFPDCGEGKLCPEGTSIYSCAQPDICKCGPQLRPPVGPP